mmetsp:Transcript_22420/g.76149  ORF Transcript_22420/g.76149 Transcript_22420/m.76149 type:complete len:1472 (+) Transcript_22420:20-4435(+)
MGRNGGGSGKHKGKKAAGATAGVALSARAEENVRNALSATRNTSAASPAPSVPGVATSSGASVVTTVSAQGAALQPKVAAVDRRRVEKVYDALENRGFNSEHIEQALCALAPATITLEAALDWLCLYVPAEQLPAGLVGGQRAYTLDHSAKDGGVVVVAAAGCGSGRLGRDPPTEDSAVELDPAEQLITLQSQRHQDQAKEDAEARAASKAWMAQYLEQQVEEHSEEEDFEWDSAADEQARAEREATESWAVWSEPSELRRRAEQRNVDESLRVPGLAEEFRQARAAVARAKANRNPDGQRQGGLIIRDLMQEMKRWGLSEDALEDAAGREGTEEAAAARECEHEEEDATPGLDLFEDFSEGEAVSKPTPAPIPPVNIDQGNVAATQEGDQQHQEFDLFDAQWSEEADEVTAVLPEAASVGQNGRIGARPNGNAEQARMPKALLQQHCHRTGLPPPRYERRDGGDAVGHSYAVVVSRSADRNSGKRASRRVGASVALSLEPEDDGWESIQDAQNAAALKALFVIAHDSGVHHQLMHPHNAMWQRWVVLEAARRQRDADGSSAARQAFIDRLIASRHALATSSTVPEAICDDAKATSSGVPRVDDEGDDATDSWEFSENVDRRAPTEKHFQEQSEQMLRALIARESSERFASMKASRAALPMAGSKDELLSALCDSDTVVVSGATGCGKTTQVPQYLLDDAILRGCGASTSVICTQPRRVAAVSVADRVATERLERSPGEHGSVVGYHVRLDAARTKETRLLFCTTGILLRRMHSDPWLEGVSHVVLDEVHERSIQSDFLAAALRDLPARRRRANKAPLKLVFMSATLDASLFARYLGGCPIVTAPGRTFPVRQLHLEDIYEELDYLLPPDSPAALRDQRRGGSARGAKGAAKGRREQALLEEGWGADDQTTVLNPNYDENTYAHLGKRARLSLQRVDEERIDYDVLEELLTHLHRTSADDGAFLVFLPGIGEVNRLKERLQHAPGFRSGGGSSTGSCSARILPLHSALSSQEQREVFRRMPRGTRKIVLATNIAETSVTLEDVTVVVDTGRVKEMQYDARRQMASLVEGWVSKASAKQRAGRAGRVRPGVCWALFTKQRAERGFKPFATPEIARVPLAEVALQAKRIGLGTIAAVLGGTPDPPSEAAVADAVTSLREVGALTSAEGSAEEGELTPLGYHLAALPLDVRVGKLVVTAALLGCLAPALTVAACLSNKSPFLHSSPEAKRALAGGQPSDHLAAVAAYDGWVAARSSGTTSAASTFCRRHGLDESTLTAVADIRAQVAALLGEAGFLGAEGRQRRHNALAAAEDSTAPWNIHARSAPLLMAVVAAGLYSNIASLQEGQWLDSSGEVAVHPGSALHGVSKPPHPFAAYHEKVRTGRVFIRECSAVPPTALLLFGGQIAVQHDRGTLTVGGRITLRAPAQTAVLFKELRRTLDAELSARIDQPDVAADANLLRTLVQLLTEDASIMK